jgi:branched-chain amino acid transport system substrate-binding protein
VVRGNRSVLLLALGVMLLLSACRADAEPRQPALPGPASPSPASSPSSTEPVPVTVAFLETRDGSEADRRAVTAFQAASLAFSNAGLLGDLPVSVEVVAHDVGQDAGEAGEIAAELAADPAVVAAIGAPGLDHQAAVGEALDEAGVSWVSLSGHGEGLGDRGWAGWRRLVADQAAQGEVVAGAVDALPDAEALCLLGDGTLASRSLLRAVAPAVRGEIVLRTVVGEAQTEVMAGVEAAGASGCGVVVWAGDGTTAAALRRQLVEEGLGDVELVGGDAMRDQGYLEAAGPAAEGTLATCPCVDVSTSIDLAAQRFIQDYQAEYGLPPGPYAVEAWDAARLLVNAFRGGATSRSQTLEAIAAVRSYEGLAGVYRFTAGGDLVAPETHVGLYEVAGGRWLEASSGA